MGKREASVGSMTWIQRSRYANEIQQPSSGVEQLGQDLSDCSQHAIASKGGRAAKKAAAEREAARSLERQASVFVGRQSRPSVVPPGFSEWKT